jgi:hypothetical protein
MRMATLFVAVLFLALAATAGVSYGSDATTECRKCSVGPFGTHHFHGQAGECEADPDECVECGGIEPTGHPDCHEDPIGGACVTHEGCPGPVEDEEQLALLLAALRSQDDDGARATLGRLRSYGRVALNQSRRAIQILDCQQDGVIASFPASAALYVAASAALDRHADD